MREIKFRAWDNEANIMVYSDHRTRKLYDVYYGFEVNEQGKLECRWEGEWNESQRLDGGTLDNIEQYTGLKDKNGKEIYEGDILQAEHFSYTGTYGLVVIKLGEYVDTGFLDDSNYEAQGVGFHAYLTKANDTSGIEKAMVEGMEVIGNIHENPELLKGGEA